MKRIKKLALVLIAFLMLTTNIYAAGNQIKYRAAQYGPGYASDNIRLIKDFFRARGQNSSFGYMYDNITAQNVREYQRANGLAVNGIVDENTRNKMNEESKNRGYNIGLRKPRVSYKGDLVIINKSSNTLHHMRNGEAMRSYSVATGRGPSMTPNGKHTIVNKRYNPVYYLKSGSAIPGGASNNPLGRRWVGLNYGGGSLYGVHGTSNPSSIGRYASSGCVRMNNNEMENIFFIEVATGTPAWIGDENRLINMGVEFYHDMPKKSRRPSNNPVYVDGNRVNMTMAIYIQNNSTYIPLRELVTLSGGKIDYDPVNRLAIAEYNGNRIEFKLNSSDYNLNSVETQLPMGQKAFVIEGSTYVPLRISLESLGFKVDYKPADRSVHISKAGKSPEIKPGKPEETEKPIEEIIETEKPEEIEKPIEEPKIEINNPRKEEYERQQEEFRKKMEKDPDFDWEDITKIW